MSIIPIKNIVIRIKNYMNSKELCDLEFFINENNFFVYPIYIKNLENIKDNFKKILDGKKTVLGLSTSSNTNNLIIIDKESIIFNSLFEFNNLHQEFYINFENNNIFRNEVRNFLNNY